jgi:hypothetical protein
MTVRYVNPGMMPELRFLNIYFRSRASWYFYW